MQLLNIVLIVFGLALYLVSYIYSFTWFVRKNFLEDYNDETTVGSMVAYAVWSLFGPVVCFAVFFNWFLKLDVWMMKVKDAPFKPRHLIQFIPLISFIGVRVLFILVYRINPKREYLVYFKYVWFNRTCYYISMFWNALFVFILFR
jgi:hypothetical protein